MNPSENLSNRQLPNIPRWLPTAFILVSFLGFIDSSYLTVKHFLATAPSCAIFDGCDVVTTSDYSEIMAIPVAMMGMFFYVTIFLLVIAYLDSKREGFLRLTSYLSIAGLLASVWFTYVQAFILEAYCFYCLLSAIGSAILFVLGMIVLNRYNKSISTL